MNFLLKKFYLQPKGVASGGQVWQLSHPGMSLPPHTNYTNQKYENIEILASHPASGLWALGNLPPPDFSLAMPLLQPIKVLLK